MSEDAGTREFLEGLREELGVVGAQVAITTPSGVEAYALGQARRDPDVEVTHRTGIQIGSTTKLFTAVQVMQLVDQGLVDLDQPVSRYLEGVELGRFEGRPGADLITPRMLLAMSSGLDNGLYIDTGDDADSVEKAVGLVRDSAITFEPGSAWGYTNASTNVSGLIVERVTGLRWGEALRRSVLDPAQLRDSATELRRQVVGPVALGFVPAPDGPRPIDQWIFTSGYGPAGSTLTSTGLDLLRFGSIFLNGGVAESGARILSEGAVAQMESPQIPVPNRSVGDHWGLGPSIRVWDGQKVVGHPGGNVAGGSLFYWLPDAGSAVAIICNVPQLVGAFTDRVMDYVFLEKFGVRKPPPAPALDAVESPGEYVGEYVRDGVHAKVTSIGGSLSAVISYSSDAQIGDLGIAHVEEYSLIPVGDDAFRLVGVDGVAIGPWNYAFGRDAQGRVQYLVDPYFASRRIA